MPTRPEDIINRALDECGCPEIGDLFEGSPAAKAALRIYTPTLRQMLSGAHWNFARKQQQLTLLGDRDAVFHTFTKVSAPWRFMYEWPVDSVHARFILYRLTSSLASDGTPVDGYTPWLSVTPFLVGSYPLPNDPASSWDQIEGHDPEQTRVIFTDQLGAIHIFTGLMQYPDSWDPLFEQAMVACLAARLAMPCQPDKKFARQVRADNITIARDALNAARVRDGNEGWTVQDHTPDWIRARSGAVGNGPGILYNGWSSVPFLEDAGGVY